MLLQSARLAALSAGSPVCLPAPAEPAPLRVKMRSGPMVLCKVLIFSRCLLGLMCAASQLGGAERQQEQVGGACVQVGDQKKTFKEWMLSAAFNACFQLR